MLVLSLVIAAQGRYRSTCALFSMIGAGNISSLDMSFSYIRVLMQLAKAVNRWNSMLTNLCTCFNVGFALVYSTYSNNEYSWKRSQNWFTNTMLFTKFCCWQYQNLSLCAIFSLLSFVFRIRIRIVYWWHINWHTFTRINEWEDYSLDLINDVNLEMQSSEHSAEDTVDAGSAFQSLIVSGKKLCL